MYNTSVTSLSNANSAPPKRFQKPSILSALLFTGFIAFFIWSLVRAEFSIVDLWQGLPNMGTIASEMVPPATHRLGSVSNAILVTFQMALVGTVIGILLSLPLALLAARNVCQVNAIRNGVRGLISFFRTVPDLAWALFFVASVGLGPFAGTLTIIVDTIGFCARFFAESIEEVDPAPAEALSSIGARPIDRIVVALIPGAMPGLINSSLFSLEKAVRSSVVLGLVGAGGIGAELAVSMEMFRYDEAATIILLIFLLVFGVEQVSSHMRDKLMQQR